jgi:hypothetical protein
MGYGKLNTTEMANNSSLSLDGERPVQRARTLGKFGREAPTRRSRRSIIAVAVSQLHRFPLPGAGSIITLRENFAARNHNMGGVAMRMLLNVEFPPEVFNQAVKDGTVGQKIRRILEDAKPEAVYFTEQNGRRGAILIIDLTDPSQVPAWCEPWFLAFNADVSIRIAMTPEDLEKAGLEALGRMWS